MAESQEALTETVYYILLSLLDPLHGYGIMQNIENLTKGRISMGPGTLYGALNTLAAKGWIIQVEREKKSRKKDYLITNQGREVLVREVERLEELVRNGKSELGGVK